MEVKRKKREEERIERKLREIFYLVIVVMVIQVFGPEEGVGKLLKMCLILSNF